MSAAPPELADDTSDSRILVVANSTTDSLTALLAEQPKEAQIVVVAPALTSRLDYWSSDDRRSRRAAQRRLDDVLAELARLDYDARGQVGDADPLQAVADALCFFPAERIIVASPAEEHINWLARNLVGPHTRTLPGRSRRRCRVSPPGARRRLARSAKPRSAAA